MIIVKLQGGLGNQLFQFAFAKALASHRKDKLYIDTNWFKKNNGATYRQFELHHLGIEFERASNKQLRIFFPKGAVHKFKKTVKEKFGKVCLIKETQVSMFQDSLFTLQGDIYLAGYWQSWKYFESISSQIKQQFLLHTNLSPTAQAVLQNIKENTPLSIHIRRNDFANNLAIRKVHGVCSLEYYRKAIRMVRNQHPNIHCFVFTDEPDWAEEKLSSVQNLKIVRKTKSYEDLFLISNCKHHIVANSTFSWWGAWLCPNPNKLVIAPKQWYADEQLNKTTVDLIPKGWIRI